MSDQLVLVTGASSTIGKALVPQLVSAGYSVLAQTRTPCAELEQLAQLQSARCRTIQVDLLASNLGEVVAASVAAAPGTLYGLVHLPSAPLTLEPAVKSSLDDFRRHMDVSVLSLHVIVASLWRAIKSSGDFRLVAANSAGAALKVPPKGMAPYLVAKAALTQYLNCLDAELRGSNAKFNQVSPEMFRSPLLNELPDYLVEQLAGVMDAGQGNYLEPPRDIVPLILYLLSPAAQNVRGQIIEISKK